MPGTPCIFIVVYSFGERENTLLIGKSDPFLPLTTDANLPDNRN